MLANSKGIKPIWEYSNVEFIHLFHKYLLPIDHFQDIVKKTPSLCSFVILSLIDRKVFLRILSVKKRKIKTRDWVIWEDQVRLKASFFPRTWKKWLEDGLLMLMQVVGKIFECLEWIISWNWLHLLNQKDFAKVALNLLQL